MAQINASLDSPDGDLSGGHGEGHGGGHGGLHFDEEWFWVFGYGVAAVLVVVLNLLLLCSICKNAFLNTNTNRAFGLLAFRNVLRASYSLVVLYATRFSHPMDDWKYSELNKTKAGQPLFCDILCSLDIFFLALPLYLMVGLVVHMFTRFPSPQIEQPAHTLMLNKRQSYNVTPDTKQLRPSEPCWVSFLLPVLPVLMAGLLVLPIPLLHLTHALQPVPDKLICRDTSVHLTFDVCVFILGYCLPMLLVFLLTFGLVVRRCLQCSASHCCNSWCKEESVLIQLFFLLVASQILLYVPVLESLAKKLSLDRQVIDDVFELVGGRQLLGRPEVARAAETAISGLALPVLCYLWLPAYRMFGSGPDPDDLKLTKPKKARSKLAGEDNAGIQMTKSNDVVVPSQQHVNADGVELRNAHGHAHSGGGGQATMTVLGRPTGFQHQQMRREAQPAAAATAAQEEDEMDDGEV